MYKHLSRLSEIFQQIVKKSSASTSKKQGQGFLVFQQTSEVIQAERCLREAGFQVEVKGPPAELRTGCDMVIVFDLMQEPLVKKLLDKNHLTSLSLVHIEGSLLEPVSLYNVQDYGDWFMVRAANMKITVERASGNIVNVSGGGCPDVPYLASLLVGQNIYEALEPRINGKTLCSYSLQRAFEEALRIQKADHTHYKTHFYIDYPILSFAKDWCFPKRKSVPWLICGTIPDKSFPLVRGHWRFVHNRLLSIDRDNPSIPVKRGTPALLAAASLTCSTLETNPPMAILAGDAGTGEGSLAIYSYLVDSLSCLAIEGITFHYLFPSIDGHNRVLMALESLEKKPALVADAGFMYVAKMSGYASSYDLFTPDIGELAFLADEKAPHPFYTRGFFLSDHTHIDELIKNAYRHDNAAHFLLIKGKEDCLVYNGSILDTVSDPQVPFLEPIGGTGDLVAGIITGLLASGFAMDQACLIGSKVARIAGQMAHPSPATSINDILPFLPAALQSFFRKCID